MALFSSKSFKIKSPRGEIGRHPVFRLLDPLKDVEVQLLSGAQKLKIKFNYFN